MRDNKVVFAAGRIRGTGESVYIFNMLTIMSTGLGWGGMITCLELAHMLNATQMVWGGGDLHTCWMLRKMLGWGWGDDNVPCTCTHVECYSTGLGRGGDDHVP